MGYKPKFFLILKHQSKLKISFVQNTTISNSAHAFNCSILEKTMWNLSITEAFQSRCDWTSLNESLHPSETNSSNVSSKHKPQFSLEIELNSQFSFSHLYEFHHVQKITGSICHSSPNIVFCYFWTSNRLMVCKTKSSAFDCAK